MQGPAYLPGFGKYLCTEHTPEQLDQAAALFERAMLEVDLASYLVPDAAPKEAPVAG
jgi:hypothetical protein